MLVAIDYRWLNSMPGVDRDPIVFPALPAVLRVGLLEMSLVR